MTALSSHSDSDSSTPDDASSLALRLRRDTAEIHRLAERSGVMAELLHGRMTRTQYVDLLRSLHVVYSALERTLDAMASHPMVRPFRHPALDRTPALERDLAALDGAHWCESLAPAPSAHRYAARISDAAPHRLVAHAYVRYLGDLSGGRSLGMVVARTLQLPDAAGLAFYEFPGIPDPDAFKHDFRRALDVMPLDHAQQNEVVAEAIDAFALNVALFEEVARQRSSSDALPPTPGR